MKIYLVCVLLISALLGCARNGIHGDSGQKTYKAEVHYYDRNGDGWADLETHHYPDLADADWELRDDDFNGRYEKKVLFGFAVVESQGSDWRYS